MKTINIYLEQGENQTSTDFDTECVSAVNGRYYHDCLKQVCDFLFKYDKVKKLTTEQQKTLDDIRTKTSVYFMKLRHK